MRNRRILERTRNAVRGAVFRSVRRFFETDDGRLILADALRSLLARPPDVPRWLVHGPPPYLDLPARTPEHRGHDRIPVFITGRFRSGSTLLWNLFRHTEGCTAYYEPFNERRWFDSTTRGTRTDPTHRHVSDYWREYDGLAVLERYYREDWIDHELYMDATAWNPAMREYVRILIDNAQGRPVLQFNRVDFRLAWLRAQFPEARLIHIYRHPRDQWCSALMGDAFPLNGDIKAFAAQDRFYLLRWIRDLRYRFPFLDERTTEHPYDAFYLLWKLSYLFGRAYAHYSIAFEDLIASPSQRIPELMETAGIAKFDLDALQNLIVKSGVGRWTEYAPPDWFLAREERCERTLAEFFGSLHTGVAVPR